MRIFKHKHFNKWAKSEKITNKQLMTTIEEMNKGHYEVNLGGFLFKKRVPRSGQGKRSGYRTLILFKRGKLAFFVYGSALIAQDEISEVK